MTRRSRKTGLVFLVALLLGAAGGASALERRDATRFNVRIGWPTAADAVEKALAGVQQRLGHPACARVLLDFEDRADRSLAEALGDQGGLEAHLASLFFYDGTTRSACRARGTLAYTEPGSHVVIVCGEKFAETWSVKPYWAEVYLIHEVLHTLGLGENPPTAHEITGGIADRCRPGPPRTASR